MKRTYDIVDRRLYDLIICVTEEPDGWWDRLLRRKPNHYLVRGNGPFSWHKVHDLSEIRSESIREQLWRVWLREIWRQRDAEEVSQKEKENL